MKKFIYSVIGLATLLLAAGCQREVNGGRDGDLVDASFSVSLEGLQTKAYSDGTSATKLQVLVYNSKGYLENVSKLNETINISTTVNLKLVKGETYDIVFWAQDPTCTAYTIDKTNAKLTVTTTGDANDEKRDAFYNEITFGPVEGPINETVKLHRPFAQINVLDNINDWNAAVDNSINFTGSSMKVKAPNALNLKSGEASGEVEYTFNVKTIDPDADSKYPILSKDGTKAYKYIAMNYILAGDKALQDVNFGVYRDNETDALYSTEVPNVPYQRNFRTIIIGNIFAVDGVFNVIIVPEYETPDYNVMLGGGDPQTITANATAPIASADGYSYNADTQTGTVSTVAGNTLNFAGAVTSNSPFDPEYYSSNTAVGTIDKTTGAFTAVAAGTTVVTIHYNAVQNGAEVKADPIINLAAADIKFTVTVTAAEVPVTLSSIAVTTKPTKLEYTVGEAFDATGMVVTATYSDETTAPVTAYTTDAPETFATAGTVTITVTFEGKTASFDVTVNPAEEAYTFVGKGTLDEPYTATDMIHYIDALTSVPSEEEVYIKGKVSSILNNGQFSAKYGNASFWISEDGTSQVFEAYRVLYLENRKWVTGDAEIAVGDDVVIYAKVTLYTPSSGDPVYETFAYTDPAYNGYLYSLNGKTKIEAAPVFEVAINNTSEVSAAGGTKTITINANVDWTVEGTTGLTFSETSGNGSATVTVTVPANTDTENGKDWTVNVKTTATGLTANAYPFNFAQAKAISGDADVTSEKVVFSENGYANQDAVETYTGSTFAISFDKGSNNQNAPKYYTTGAAVRCYGGNTFTVSASKAIKKIVFTFASGEGTNAITATPGEFVADTATWTGDSTSVAFTIDGTSGHRRIAAIEVFYVVE